MSQAGTRCTHLPASHSGNLLIVPIGMPWAFGRLLRPGVLAVSRPSARPISSRMELGAREEDGGNGLVKVLRPGPWRLGRQAEIGGKSRGLRVATLGDESPCRAAISWHLGAQRPHSSARGYGRLRSQYWTVRIAVDQVALGKNGLEE